MKWPPLIDSVHLPWWVVARDTLATLLAWGLLLYFIRDMVVMAVYWTLRGIGIDFTPPWAPGEMWRDAEPFLKVVGLLTLWLTTFALARWRLLTNRQRATRQPLPLDPLHQAEALDVPADVLATLQDARSATVLGVDPESGRGSVGMRVETEPRPDGG